MDRNLWGASGDVICMGPNTLRTLTKPRPHNWVYHTCGRTCSECMVTQAKGEYDDAIACAA